MQGCNNDYSRLIGKVAILRFAFGCPDEEPGLAEFQRIGALTTKGLDFAMNSLTSDADDAKGLTENAVTGIDLTISGDGEWRRRPRSTEIGPMRMGQYILNEIQAGRQPTLWARFDFTGENTGDYIIGYFVTTAWSGDFGSSDFATFSGEWKVSDADTVRMSAASDILVTGVTVVPATLSMEVNDQEQLTATVLPETATNQNVTWKSSDESIAIVSTDGIVTALSAGTVDITCSAIDGSGASGKSVVTITEA